jgi:hypothetical protein
MSSAAGPELVRTTRACIKPFLGGRVTLEPKRRSSHHFLELGDQLVGIADEFVLPEALRGE